MPSDPNGVYSLPAGYLAVPGDVIQDTQHNPPLEDLAAGATARLMRSGAGAMTGAIKLIDGTAGSPAAVFATALTTGWFKTSTGIGFAISGTQVAEITASGFQLNREQVVYKYIQKPSGVSKVLGTPSVAAKTITGAVNNGSGLIRITVADTSDLTTGVTKTITGVTGTTEANGTWTLTVISGTTVDLQGSAFVNAYVSGGTLGGFVEELTLGTGLTLTKNVLAAPATPFPGGFKSLSIKVATTTTVACAADFVTMTDGTNYLTLAASGTINLGTTGANALDTGTIAISTWYFIWAIAKADGTTAWLASTSSTSPTMPSGYTYKARYGAVRTIAGSATLYGTWQLGRRAQYVVGLAQTTAMPVMSSANTSGTITAVAVANFVPTTAGEIFISINTTGGNTQVYAAPNASYSGPTSTTNPAPMSAGIGTGAIGSTFGSFVLESSNVYWGSSSTGCGIWCNGWTDNI